MSGMIFYSAWIVVNIVWNRMLEIFLFKLLMITRVQLMFQIPLSVGWLFLMGKGLPISKVKSSIRPAEQTLFLFYSWILDLMSREPSSVGRKKREKKSPRRPQDMVWASALLCSALYWLCELLQTLDLSEPRFSAHEMDMIMPVSQWAYET